MRPLLCADLIGLHPLLSRCCAWPAEHSMLAGRRSVVAVTPAPRRRAHLRPASSHPPGPCLCGGAMKAGAAFVGRQAVCTNQSASIRSHIARRGLCLWLGGAPISVCRASASSAPPWNTLCWG